MLLKFQKADNEQISSHFNLREFRCKCHHPECKTQLIDSQLIARLELVREHIDSPIQILSGYRCALHQADLRRQGYETSRNISQHQLGKAADIFIPRRFIPPDMLLLLENYFQAIGVAQNWFHVDMRSDKRRQWSYS